MTTTMTYSQQLQAVGDAAMKYVLDILEARPNPLLELYDVPEDDELYDVPEDDESEDIPLEDLEELPTVEHDGKDGYIVCIFKSGAFWFVQFILDNEYTEQTLEEHSLGSMTPTEICALADHLASIS